MSAGHLINLASGHLKQAPTGHLTTVGTITGNISFQCNWNMPGGYVAGDQRNEYDLDLYVRQPDGFWLGYWENQWVGTPYSIGSIWPFLGDNRSGGTGAVYWNAYPPFYLYPGQAPGHVCPETVRFPTIPAPEGTYMFFVREWDAGQGLSNYFLGVYRDSTLIWGGTRGLSSYPHYSPLFGFNSLTNTVYLIDNP